MKTLSMRLVFSFGSGGGVAKEVEDDSLALRTPSFG
jgi:hypothetical protein